MRFALIRNGLEYPKIVAWSHVIRFTNPNLPHHGHLALTANPRCRMSSTISPPFAQENPKKKPFQVPIVPSMLAQSAQQNRFRSHKAVGANWTPKLHHHKYQ